MQWWPWHQLDQGFFLELNSRGGFWPHLAEVSSTNILTLCSSFLTRGEGYSLNQDHSIIHKINTKVFEFSVPPMMLPVQQFARGQQVRSKSKGDNAASVKINMKIKLSTYDFNL